MLSWPFIAIIVTWSESRDLLFKFGTPYVTFERAKLSLLFSLLNRPRRVLILDLLFKFYGQ